MIVEIESQVLQWEDDFDELDSVIHFMSIEEGEELLSVGKDLGEEGDVAWLREQIAQRASEELASIIYTSGTTGKIEGSVIDTQNFTSNLESTKEVLPLPAGSRSLVCLPLGHSLQRFVVYRAFVEDIEGYFAPSFTRDSSDNSSSKTDNFDCCAEDVREDTKQDHTTG